VHSHQRRPTTLRSFSTQILLSAGVAAVIVWRVPFGNLRAAFRTLQYGSLLTAVGCFVVLLLLRVYKWHRLLGAVGKVHIKKTLRSLFGGFALGLITPGRLGELGRCVFVREEERAQVALLTLLDRLFDLWALLTLVGASLFFLVPHAAAIFGVVVWLALLPVVMSLPRLVAHLTKLVRKSWHHHAHIVEAAKGLHGVQTPIFAVLAVATVWTEMASFFFLLRTFFPAEYTTTVATFPYIVLAGDLPLSFSGVGVREGAAAMLLSPYAVPASVAVDASLLWFVFAILLPAALGSVWLVVEKFRSRLRYPKALSSDNHLVRKPRPLQYPPVPTATRAPASPPERPSA
jgi:glycosyltransferase 2 family protein